MVYSTAVGVFRLFVGAGKVLVKVDEQIIELYKKYGNCREVSEQLGVSGETVRRVLIKHDIPRTSGNKRTPQYKRPRVVVPIDEVIRLYQEGKSTIELGKLYGCHQNTISRKLKQAGVETRPQGKSKVELDMDEVQRLRENGESMEKIAERFGTTKFVVVKRCMEHGIVYGKGHSPSNKKANHDPSRKKEGSKPHSGKSHRKRAREFGVEYDSSITWQSLSRELGHLNCQICGEPCDPNDTSWNGYFGPLYPTVDCIVAMKNGGGYVRGNVQLAHAICNSIKRDLNDYDDIAEAVSQHAPNGGRNSEWEQAQTAQNISFGNRRVDRRRGRVSQHGAACTAIPRDDTRNCRARSGVG